MLAQPNLNQMYSRRWMEIAIAAVVEMIDLSGCWLQKRRSILFLVLIAVVPFSAIAGNVARKRAVPGSTDYQFDGTISRKVLENYLDRSATMAYFLVPGTPEGHQYPYRNDDVRLIKNTGAKFIGRAIYRWGEESRLNDPAFWSYAKNRINLLHVYDPDIIFQACLFEYVSDDVNKVKIPGWVFTAFGLPVEKRTFCCDSMIHSENRLTRFGKNGGIPLINNQETRLWFYYLAASYINSGCEALHLGQVGLIGAEDKGLKVYARFLTKIRAYAKIHGRRHLVLLDAHVPTGGMIQKGISLLDFNSFPLRIKEVPGKPHEGVLEVHYLDALFQRSKGCIAPSGWSCKSLPYLVELDNYGRGQSPNVADTTSIFVWGWDEISWFSLQPEAYRDHWLRYAWNWIKKNDPNGHLEMPVSRMISCPNATDDSYRANTKSSSCPIGYSQEETIKEIWNGKLIR